MGYFTAKRFDFFLEALEALEDLEDLETQAILFHIKFRSSRKPIQNIQNIQNFQFLQFLQNVIFPHQSILSDIACQRHCAAGDIFSASADAEAQSLRALPLACAGNHAEQRPPSETQTASAVVLP